MRIFGFAFVMVLCVASICFAQDKNVLLDDFEGTITTGPDGTADFGAGGGSSVEVEASADIKHSGNQCLKVIYNAVPGGYMWVARGFDLEAKNAAWQVKPQDIKWDEYKAISFYMYGSDSQARVAFDIKDNGNEMWRYIVEDNFIGWREILSSFDEFFCRTDWQPANADKNGVLDFPLKNYQFEPLPESKGTFYFDAVELLRK